MLAMTGGVGTPFFMAPEIVKGSAAHVDHPFACDVYSFAILAWCVLSGERQPYVASAECAGLGAHVITRMVVHEGLRPELPAQHPTREADAEVSWPSKIRDLLERCWSALPTERPDFGSVLSELKDMRGDFEFACACKKERARRCGGGGGEEDNCVRINEQ